MDMDFGNTGSRVMQLQMFCVWWQGAWLWAAAHAQLFKRPTTSCVNLESITTSFIWSPAPRTSTSRS